MNKHLSIMALLGAFAPAACGSASDDTNPDAALRPEPLDTECDEPMLQQSAEPAMPAAAEEDATAELPESSRLLKDLTAAETTTACEAFNARFTASYRRNGRGFCTFGGAHASLSEVQCDQSVEACVSTFNAKLAAPPSCEPTVTNVKKCEANVSAWAQCVDATIGKLDDVLPLYQCSMTGDQDALTRLTAKFEATTAACESLRAECPEMFYGGHSRSVIGTIPASVCSDGIIAGPEECDDGNNGVGDGCSAICELENRVLELEPNDEFSAATRLDVRSVLRGTIRPTGGLADADYIAVQLTSGSTYTFRTFVGGLGLCATRADSTTNDTVLTLFGADHAELDQNDDAFDRCSALTFRPSESGTYFLRISPFDDSRFATVAPYYLDIEVE